jgi:hypothetical protein
MNYQLESIINKETLFDHAIKLLLVDDNDSVGQQILSWYVLNELPEGHTEDEFHEKYELYLIQGTLKSLCAKDLLDFDFESKTYVTTELGEKVKKGLNDNK